MTASKADRICSGVTVTRIDGSPQLPRTRAADCRGYDGTRRARPGRRASRPSLIIWAPTGTVGHGRGPKVDTYRPEVRYAAAPDDTGDPARRHGKAPPRRCVCVTTDLWTSDVPEHATTLRDIGAFLPSVIGPTPTRLALQQGHARRDRHVPRTGLAGRSPAEGALTRSPSRTRGSERVSPSGRTHPMMARGRKTDAPRERVYSMPIGPTSDSSCRTPCAESRARTSSSGSTRTGRSNRTSGPPLVIG